ncbi:hypothetical protein CBR_g23797 [Chara braunii]|uniref:Small ribosomal subunit protein mS35 mitochondrial conserved domain-containing protein n=1 Tax=Chara braunii TaxID=69332 RepID=A0A388JVU4_CHABU|nr:hypothetical protein CBR_g23797 [Chara braunii]|eukprot:GBG61842.1 hypothetical protein CBR_g23797 [Chara braunii]
MRGLRGVAAGIAQERLCARYGGGLPPLPPPPGGLRASPASVPPLSRWRPFSGEAENSGQEKEKEEGTTPTLWKRHKRRTRAQKGNYDDSFEAELDTYMPEVRGPLYDARGMVDQQMRYDVEAELKKVLEHPTVEGLLPESEPTDEPEEGEEGPRLRWETRLILGPGGKAWHPANRKVKVRVYVRELGLSAAARERLLALAGPRYNTNKDELTIVSERYALREENRKDVLQILYALLEEAKNADQLALDEFVEAAQTADLPTPDVKLMSTPL